MEPGYSAHWPRTARILRAIATHTSETRPARTNGRNSIRILIDVKHARGTLAVRTVSVSCRIRACCGHSAGAESARRALGRRPGQRLPERSERVRAGRRVRHRTRLRVTILPRARGAASHLLRCPHEQPPNRDTSPGVAAGSVLGGDPAGAETGRVRRWLDRLDAVCGLNAPFRSEPKRNLSGFTRISKRSIIDENAAGAWHVAAEWVSVRAYRRATPQRWHWHAFPIQCEVPT